MKTATVHSRFHVGDHVSVELGRRRLTGVIVEDQGPLGIQGRHIFQVEIPQDPLDPMSVSLTEDDIEAIDPSEVAAPTIPKQKIVDYLVNGGLISILRSNGSNEKQQPRVWLTRDQLGNVTHTHNPHRGVLGGDPVPPSALHGTKINAQTLEAVLKLLSSFGLTLDEGESIAAHVGIAPAVRFFNRHHVLRALKALAPSLPDETRQDLIRRIWMNQAPGAGRDQLDAELKEKYGIPSVVAIYESINARPS